MYVWAWLFTKIRESQMAEWRRGEWRRGGASRQLLRCDLQRVWRAEEYGPAACEADTVRGVFQSPKGSRLGVVETCWNWKRYKPHMRIMRIMICLHAMIPSISIRTKGSKSSIRTSICFCRKSDYTTLDRPPGKVHWSFICIFGAHHCAKMWISDDIRYP